MFDNPENIFTDQAETPQAECPVQQHIAIVEKLEQNAIGVITLFTCPNDAHLHFTAKVDSRESQGQTRFFPHKQIHATHKEAVRQYNKALKLTAERGFKITHYRTERNWGWNYLSVKFATA